MNKREREAEMIAFGLIEPDIIQVGQQMRMREVPWRPRKPAPPGGPYSLLQGAEKLSCSIKTLRGHIASGALKYVAVGHGTKRQRRMLTDADLNEFISNQTRKDVPCPSDGPALPVLAIQFPNPRSSLFRLDEMHDPAGSREDRGGRAREGQEAGGADCGEKHRCGSMTSSAGTGSRWAASRRCR